MRERNKEGVADIRAELELGRDELSRTAEIRRRLGCPEDDAGQRSQHSTSDTSHLIRSFGRWSPSNDVSTCQY